MLVLLSALSAGGCDYAHGLAQDLRLPFATRSGKKLVAAVSRPYPAAAEIGPPLEIEVIRDGDAILLDNRTVQGYEGVDLWLNQQYGGTVDIVPIGRGEALALTSFLNRYGEHYPIARFLRPELDRSLIAAEMFISGKLHKLTVRLEEDWREAE